jgi:hypothetical protein
VNGSRSIRPASTRCSTRLNAEGTAFEPENDAGPHNIDGGGASPPIGMATSVVWHANAAREGEEGKRRVWVPGPTTTAAR